MYREALLSVSDVNFDSLAEIDSAHEEQGQRESVRGRREERTVDLSMVEAHLAGPLLFAGLWCKVEELCEMKSILRFEQDWKEHPNKVCHVISGAIKHLQFRCKW